MTSTKAKRGDLVAIETTRHDYVIGQGSTTRTEYTMFEVTGITRDGQVRTVRELAYDGTGYPIDRIIGLGQRWVLAATRIDKDRASDVVRSHTYPNSTTPRAYDSLDALREALRPCLLAS
jgi:hypothetical protein